MVFLKAPSTETGHPANSTPLHEQTFLVQTINALMKLPEWKNMAILITYDDSDGWYDHVMPPVVNQSNDPANDTLLGHTGTVRNTGPRRYLRPLRLWNAASAAGDFALCETELR